MNDWSPAIHVDPSGAAVPILYYDANGAGDPSCYDRVIGYPVRKWQIALAEHDGGGLAGTEPGWRNAPMSHADY
ncbi:hypothetical protein [Nonomuraea cavernae]|uniref:hypothetical protein n=1 Tax=Nonomuraea cavernae TaxID=2045107 RepID=UPI0033CB04ED